jgi:hypothetical protein
MALHRLTTITLGVPDVAAVAAFYREFGLPRPPRSDHGGEQLAAPATRRGLVELGLGADDPDDVARIARALAGLGIAASHDTTALQTVEPVTGLAVTVTVTPRATRPGPERPACNAPGRAERTTRPADGVLRDQPVRPMNLSHVAIARPIRPRPRASSPTASASRRATGCP